MALGLENTVVWFFKKFFPFPSYQKPTSCVASGPSSGPAGLVGKQCMLGQQPRPASWPAQPSIETNDVGVLQHSELLLRFSCVPPLRHQEDGLLWVERSLLHA